MMMEDEELLPDAVVSTGINYQNYISITANLIPSYYGVLEFFGPVTESDRQMYGRDGGSTTFQSKSNTMSVLRSGIIITITTARNFCCHPQRPQIPSPKATTIASLTFISSLWHSFSGRRRSYTWLVPSNSQSCSPLARGTV